MSNVYKEFMDMVFGLDYKLFLAKDNDEEIKNIVMSGYSKLQYVTALAEDAMEYLAGFAVEHGVDKTMQELTRIERLHTHYIDTLAEHHSMFA